MPFIAELLEIEDNLSFIISTACPLVLLFMWETVTGVVMSYLLNNRP